MGKKIEKKGADAHMETIVKKYGPDAKGKVDKSLYEFLNKSGYSSLSALLRPKKGKKSSGKKNKRDS